MKQVQVGRTGLKVSELTFGTMSFGGIADEATSAKMFAQCRDAGITSFDCANVYGKGASETILGRLIAPCRNEIVLSTKAYFPTGAGANDRGTSRVHLRQAVEDSLRRLQTDRIDLFYLHRFDDLTPLDETLRALDDLVCQGKIIYPAASNFAAWQVSKALGRCALHHWSPLVCIQPMYNLVKRQAEVELLPMAAAEGLGVFPYSPMGGGLLSGKYSSTQRPSEGRLVDNPMYGIRYGDPRCFDIAEQFTALAREQGHAPAPLAVAWVAAHPSVTSPIIGARNPDQLAEVLGAKDIQLTQEARQALSALSPAPPPATDRNEERSTHNYGSR